MVLSQGNSAAARCVALVVGELLWLLGAWGVVTGGVGREWWHVVVAGIVLLIVCVWDTWEWVTCADAYGVVGEVVCTEELMALLEVGDCAFGAVVLRVVVDCVGIWSVVVLDGVLRYDVG